MDGEVLKGLNGWECCVRRGARREAMGYLGSYEGGAVRCGQGGGKNRI